MCGGPDIPEQDPRFAEASMRQVQLSEQMYADYVSEGGDRDWMRGVTDDAIGILRSGEERASELQDYQMDQMQRHDDRYWGQTVPLENELLAQVRAMDSEEYREREAGIARNTAGQQFDQVQQQGIRQMSRMGVNVNDGKFASVAGQMAQAKALAMTSAANKTRAAAQQVGLANKMQLYGGMRGMAGLGATSASLATGANGQAMAAGQGMTGAAGSSISANNQTFGTTMQGMGSGISGYNQYYGNSVNAYSTAANSQGEMMGAGIGAAATMAAAFI
jgi:hypothetical protein